MVQVSDTFTREFYSKVTAVFLTAALTSVLSACTVGGGDLTTSGPAAPEGGGGGGGGGPFGGSSCTDGEVKDFGIVNGKTLSRGTALGMATVMITQNLAGGKASRCTGTLVDNNTILTAAHCVDQAQKPEDISVSFASRPTCESHTKTLEETVALDVKMHPGYDPNNRNVQDDIALVSLSTTAPTWTRTVRLYGAPLSLKRGSAVHVAGFGKTTDYEEEDNSEVRLRLKELKLAKAFSPKSAVLTLDQKDGGGVCPGDSGGPSLVAVGGTIFQVGVASTVSFAENEKPNCFSSAVYMSIQYYRNWLEGVFPQLKRPEDAEQSETEKPKRKLPFITPAS